MRPEFIEPRRGNLGATCDAVLLRIALMQPEPERTEFLAILRDDGSLSGEDFARLVGEAA